MVTTILICVVLAGLLASAGWSVYKNSKKGGCGSCGGCPHSQSCSHNSDNQ